MSTDNYLLVNINTEAMLASEGQQINSANADFSGLPYATCDNGQSTATHNSTAYIGSSVNTLRSDEQLSLAGGMHLHWQLPKGIAKTMGIQLISVYFLNQLEGDYINAGGSDWVSDAPLLWTALQTLQWTKAISGNTVYASVMPLTQRLSGNLGSSATNAISPDAINAIQPQISAYVLRSLGDQFPPVPDLWHISRSGGTQVGSSTALADDSWIIESSAISDTLPANSALSDDATFSPNIPFAKDPNAAGIPFRYIGTSTTPATDWTPGSFTDTTKYLQELTAVGYNPQANASGYINYEFANLYPNCMGVFSLCDTAVSKASQSQTNPVVYQLIGSYSQPENDYLYLFVQDYINRNLNSSNQIQISQAQMLAIIQDSDASYYASHFVSLGNNSAISSAISTYLSNTATDTVFKAINQQFNENLVAAIEKEFGWTISLKSATYSSTLGYSGSTVQIPQYSLYGSQINIIANGDQLPETLSVDVSLANTGTEALSSYLAEKIATSSGETDTAATIENQLEALQQANNIQNQYADIDHIVDDLRHKNGFTALPGGTLWQLVNSADDTQNANNISQSLGEQLDAVNLLQQQYDQQLDTIESLRIQLYANWQLYLQAIANTNNTGLGGNGLGGGQGLGGGPGLGNNLGLAGNGLGGGQGLGAGPGPGGNNSGLGNGSPGSGGEQSPNEELDPATIRCYFLQISLPQLQTALDTAGELYIPLDSSGNFSGGAGDLSTQKNSYAAQLSSTLNTLANNIDASLQLKKQGAARYWQATDPAILISGSSLGEALSDLAYPLTQAALTPAVAAVTVNDTLPADVLKLPTVLASYFNSDKPIALKHWTNNQFKPLAINWQAELLGIDNTTTADQGNITSSGFKGFGSDFINKNYTLAETATDLTLSNSKASTFDANPVVINGLSYLSPMAGMQLQTSVESYLLNWIQNDLSSSYQSSLHITAAEQSLSYTLQNLSAFKTWVSGTYFSTATFKPVTATSLSLNEQLQTWLSDNLSTLITQYQASDYSYTSTFVPNLMLAQQLIASTPTLAQTLGGFNRAMLQQHQAIQVPVADPLGASSCNCGNSDCTPLCLTYTIAQALGQHIDYTKQQTYCSSLTLNSSDLGDACNGTDCTSNNVTNLPVFRASSALAPKPHMGFSVLSDNIFMPLRQGQLDISKVKLISNFGVNIDVSSNGISAISQSLNRNTDAADTTPFFIPPRLTQAARLNLRFLSSTNGSQESNLLPASTPICGWILPNIFDNSLAFYDQDGVALGSITNNTGSLWQAAPGGHGAASVNAFSNIYLMHTANNILSQAQIDSSYLTDLIACIDSALANIQPSNFADNQNLSLLIGRPLAVVRTSVQLQLKGLAATDISQSQFLQQLNNYTAGVSDICNGSSNDTIIDYVNQNANNTQAFEQLNIGVRIGEYHMLNDGLVGYWQETNNTPSGSFYSQSAVTANSTGLVTYDNNSSPGTAIDLNLTPNSPAQTLTMLVDPHGSIHATCGLLPTKNINIPAHYYEQAINTIAATFLTAPMLTPVDELRLPLPEEAGYNWAWIENQNGQWQSTSQTASINQTVFSSGFPDNALYVNLWSQAISAGLLTQIGISTTATILPKDQRGLTSTAGSYNLGSAYQNLYTQLKASNSSFSSTDMATLQSNIDRFLDANAKAINPEITKAKFDSEQMLREGWLQLSPQIDNT